MSNTSTHSIRINSIIKESIVDGFGIRLVVFTQGCLLNCSFCHNPQTQDLDGGKLMSLDEIQRIWQSNPLLKGITISGGEPFLQPKGILQLTKLAHQDNLDVTIYTGYTYELLTSKNSLIINEILHEADYLIDGPYIHKLKNLNLLFRGSSNQRIIDLQQTNFQKEIITLD